MDTPLHCQWWNTAHMVTCVVAPQLLPVHENGLDAQAGPTHSGWQGCVSHCSSSLSTPSHPRLTRPAFGHYALIYLPYLRQTHGCAGVRPQRRREQAAGPRDPGCPHVDFRRLLGLSVDNILRSRCRGCPRHGSRHAGPAACLDPYCSCVFCGFGSGYMSAKQAFGLSRRHYVVHGKEHRHFRMSGTLPGS